MYEHDGQRCVVVAFDLDVQGHTVIGVHRASGGVKRAERLVGVGVRSVASATYRSPFQGHTGSCPGGYDADHGRGQSDSTSAHASSSRYVRGTRGPIRVTIS